MVCSNQFWNRRQILNFVKQAQNRHLILTHHLKISLSFENHKINVIGPTEKVMPVINTGLV